MLLENPECVAKFVESAHMQSSRGVENGVGDPSDAENFTVILVDSDICSQEPTPPVVRGNGCTKVEV